MILLCPYSSHLESPAAASLRNVLFPSVLQLTVLQCGFRCLSIMNCASEIRSSISESQSDVVVLSLFFTSEFEQYGIRVPSESEIESEALFKAFTCK